MFASCSLGTWWVTSHDPTYRGWYFWENKRYLQAIRLAHDEWHLVIWHTGDDTFEKIEGIWKMFAWHKKVFASYSLGTWWVTSRDPTYRRWHLKRYLQAIRLAHDEWHLVIRHAGDDTFEVFASYSLGTWWVAFRDPTYRDDT